MFIHSLSTDTTQTFTIKHAGNETKDIVLAISVFIQTNGGEWKITVSATDSLLENIFVQSVTVTETEDAYGNSLTIPLRVQPNAIITILAEQLSVGTSSLRLCACVLYPDPGIAGTGDNNFGLVSN